MDKSEYKGSVYCKNCNGTGRLKIADQLKQTSESLQNKRRRTNV